MLSTNLITGRRQAYALCAAEADYAALQDQIYGDTKCAAKNTARAMFYWWAQDVMERTPIATDHCADCKCVTDEFACEVIRLMDPGCVTCGCGAPSDRPISCELTGTYGVAADVDASFESNAVTGQSYLIVSDINDAGNTWADNIGNIAYNGTFTTPTEGALIYNVLNNDYWVNIGGAAYPYFPRINANRNLFAITLTSAAPEVNDYFDRTVVIRISADGTNWIGLFVGSEQDIPSTPITTTINDAIYVDVSYLTQDDACTYGPFLGLVTAQQEPQPTNSFRVSPVALAYYMAPVDGGIMDFNPADESQFVISFNVKATYIDPSFSFFLPLTLIATKQNPGAACVSTGLYFWTSIYMSQQEYGFVMAVEPVVGPTIGGGIIFPGAYAAAFDGSWHNVTIVRDATTPGTLVAGDFSMWVDNTRYGAVLDPGFVSGSYPVPTGVTYFPSAGYGLQYQQIGDTFGFTTDFTFNNFYIAAYAPSPAEIASICYPAAYEGNDGSWSRRLWIRARQPDNLVASPWVNGNSPFSSAWQEGSPGDGGVTLVPDAPTWVVP